MKYNHEYYIIEPGYYYTLKPGVELFMENDSLKISYFNYKKYPKKIIIKE
jgi:hypothetical protein